MKSSSVPLGRISSDHMGVNLDPGKYGDASIDPKWVL